MSNREFENYLKLVGKLLQLSRSQQDLIAEELRDHLESRISDLVQNGVSHGEAVTMALEEFGDAAAMAKNFQFVSQMKRRRWMMRFATLSTAGVFLVVIFAMSMWPSDARFGAPDEAIAQAGRAESAPTPIPIELSASTQRNMEIERKLALPATLEYDDSPWSDIQEELENEYKINIWLDQTAIDDSLTAGESISIALRGVPFEKALSLMLQNRNATFIVDDGIIRIISLDEAENQRFMKVKTYDCRYIIARLDPSKSAQTIGDAKKPIVSKQDLLLDLIYSMTTTDAWIHTGGIANARIVNDILIVQHTRKGFNEIESLLQDLNYRINNIETDGAISSSGRLNNETSAEVATAASSAELPLAGSGVSADPFEEFSSESSTEASVDPFDFGETEN